MKEYDKRNSPMSSKLRMNYISSNNDRHPASKTCTALHYTSPNYISIHFTTFVDTSLHFFPFKFHPSTLHYPLIWLKLI